jgi:hypothetical protein
VSDSTHSPLVCRISLSSTTTVMSKRSVSSGSDHCAVLEDNKSTREITILKGSTPTKSRSVDRSAGSKTHNRTHSQKMYPDMPDLGKALHIVPLQHLYRPYPGNLMDPVDVCVDAFLSSRSFELTCVQAVQLAAVLPTEPPPTNFISFDRTPMHHWYQAILIEFVDCFMRRLRSKERFPVRQSITRTEDGYKLKVSENADAFNDEAIAHINAILLSFNIDFANRAIGNTSGLTVDSRMPHAADAKVSLYEATSHADFPPKKDWKVGDTLACEYRKRLRMFEGGVMRLLADSESDRWILGLPERLNRGIAAYKEYYIHHLRQEILTNKQMKQCIGKSRDDVFT